MAEISYPRIAPPDSGVHIDQPMLAYLRWRAEHNSGLGCFSDGCPCEYYDAERSADFTDSQTDATALGSLLHALLLGDTQAEISFVCGLAIERRSQADKQTWALFEAEQAKAGKRIIPVKVWDKAAALKKKIATHPANEKVLIELGRMIGHGHVEESVVFEDPGSGLKCKVRPDAYDPVDGVVFDIKTTSSALGSQYHLDKAFYEFGYWTGAPFQLDGLARVHDRPFTTFKIIWISTATGLARIQYVQEADIALGRATYQSRLKWIARCEAAGEWPGYTDETPVGLPKFIRERLTGGA